ncbi:MAG TPA: acyltransferase family protein [Steroidobacteraceae bacterium]|nr:acyltransferase family protein [Steroidobacteraceae bacterium]
MSAAASSPSSTTTAGAPRAQRVAWVDYSKGICIFLVVMLHSNLAVQDTRGAEGWLEYVVAFARPFRMPDFFLIAGLFLGNTIDRPWRVYFDKKVLHFLYFYLLWTAIQFALFDTRAYLNQGRSGGQIAFEYLRTFIEPEGSLWFIHSLALYFLVVRLTRAVPWWLMLAITGGLQCANIHTGWTVIDEFARRFVYFYSGYVAARYVFRLAEWGYARPGSMALYLLCWALANETLVREGWSTLPGVGLVLGYVGALAVVFFGVTLSQLRGTRWLRYLGENSIVVYLGYYTCEHLSMKFRVNQIPDIGTAALVLTVLDVFGALLMFWIAMRLGVRFLYRRPPWARIEAAPPPSAVPLASAS